MLQLGKRDDSMLPLGRPGTEAPLQTLPIPRLCRFSDSLQTTRPVRFFSAISNRSGKNWASARSTDSARFTQILLPAKVRFRTL
jgi:hypothetical protein